MIAYDLAKLLTDLYLLRHWMPFSLDGSYVHFDRSNRVLNYGLSCLRQLDLLLPLFHASLRSGRNI